MRSVISTIKRLMMMMMMMMMMVNWLFLYFSHKNRTICWRCVHCYRWQIACFESSKVYPSWVCITLTCSCTLLVL